MSAEPSAQRWFFALWPDVETAQLIWQQAADWVAEPKARRLAAQQVHLTLAFLGRLEQEQIACLKQVAQGLQAMPFELTLDQAGYFTRARVAWLGVRQIPPILQSFQSKLVNQLKRQCAYQPESRPFVPHVTLWRKAKQCHLPALVEPIVWSVQRFVLARSRSLAVGPEYSIVESWPLLAQA